VQVLLSEGKPSTEHVLAFHFNEKLLHQVGILRKRPRFVKRDRYKRPIKETNMLLCCSSMRRCCTSQTFSERDLHLWEETYERDLHLWEETCERDKHVGALRFYENRKPFPKSDVHLWKETYESDPWKRQARWRTLFQWEQVDIPKKRPMFYGKRLMKKIQETSN